MMFDFSSVLFWYKLLFTAEIIVAELIFVANLRRRSRFILRAVGSVGGLFLFAFLFPIVAYNAVWTCFMFFMMFFASLCAIKICFKECWWNIVFCGLAAYTIQHISFVLFDALSDVGEMLLGLELQSNVYLQDQTIAFAPSLAISVLLYVVSYFTIYMVSHYIYTDKIRPDEVSRLGRKQFVVLAGIIIITDIIFHSVTTYNAEIDVVSLWLERGYNVVTCLLALQLQFSQLTEQNMQTKYDAVQHILREEQKQYMIVKQNLDTINIKCHDMKHQLRAIRVGGAKIDNAELEEIGRVLAIYESVVKTGNETLDLILAEKNLMHGSKNIQITCIADGALLDFMTPTDMYSLFGNALDNAIEAVSALDNSKRTISFFVKRVGNMISIHIENYYCGERLLVSGLPKTTKQDEEYHGYGMLSMKTIAEKYGGTLAVELGDHTFSLNIMFPALKQSPSGSDFDPQDRK